MHREQNNPIFRNLKIARGQVDGIIKMLEEDRYCIDVSRQILATISILKKVNAEILHDHMKGCVKKAIINDGGDESLEELLDIMRKYL
ncbi:MAG: metal-sensing transcriptional repressor [Clostridiales bacterium]|nr:metal-sensing transcriptional repressor [Clostridiales bacterium]